MKLLEEMGCIEKVQRGARHVDSILYLHKAPVLTDFYKLDPESFGDAKSEAFNSYKHTTDAELRTIRELIGGVNIQQTLADHQIRIEKLQRKVKSLENQLSNQATSNQGETKP